MKDELGGKIITEFIAHRTKTYLYLTDGDTTRKKAKGTKKMCNKTKTKFNDYKDCLFKNEIILKSLQIFKSEAHNAYTDEINKIAISSNDDKRLKTFDNITTYPYGTKPFQVCKSEMLEHLNIKWLILMIILMKIK